MTWTHRIVLFAVLSVWILVYLTDVYSKDFTAPPEVSGVLLAIVTAIFGPAFFKNMRNGGKDG